MVTQTTMTTAMNQLLPQFSFHHLMNAFWLLGWEPGPEGARGRVPFPAVSLSSLYHAASWLYTATLISVATLYASPLLTVTCMQSTR